MKTQQRQLLSIPLLTGILLSCAVGGALAQEEPGPIPFNQRHQVGIRMGAWANLGGLPNSDFVIDDGLTRVSTDITNASFYLEAYFGYRLTPVIMLEISGGVANRGDVIQQTGQIQDIGSLNMYPILIQARLYSPLVLFKKWHPYVMAGAGLYYGRNSIQISNELFFADLRETSETEASWMLGGGVDWALASQIGLDLNVKYMPVKFNDLLLDLEDWQALTITVGVKYLWVSSKK